MKKILIAILFTLLLVSVVFARSVTTETEKVEMKDADRILLKGELGAGEFKRYALKLIWTKNLTMELDLPLVSLSP